MNKLITLLLIATAVALMACCTLTLCYAQSSESGPTLKVFTFTCEDLGKGYERCNVYIPGREAMPGLRMTRKGNTLVTYVSEYCMLNKLVINLKTNSYTYLTVQKNICPRNEK